MACQMARNGIEVEITAAELKAAEAAFQADLEKEGNELIEEDPANENE